MQRDRTDVCRERKPDLHMRNGLLFYERIFLVKRSKRAQARRRALHRSDYGLINFEVSLIVF